MSAAVAEDYVGVAVGVDRYKDSNKVDTLRGQRRQEVDEAHGLMDDTTS